MNSNKKVQLIVIKKQCPKKKKIKLNRNIEKIHPVKEEESLPNDLISLDKGRFKIS